MSDSVLYKDDPYIRMMDGHKFYFTNLERNCGIPIDPFIYGIGNLVRFTGQGSCGKDYDVLKHSYVCASIALYATMWDGALYVGAFFHDLPESVTGDMSSPLKKIMPEYKGFSARIEEWFETNFKLPPIHSEKIKAIDTLVGDVEGEMFLKGWEPLPTPNESVKAQRKLIKTLIEKSMLMDNGAIAKLMKGALARYNGK